MDSSTRSRFKGAENILLRSKSLYDGTKNTMRLSSIKTKLQTVSSSLANSSPFSTISKEKESAALDGSARSGRSGRDESEKPQKERSRTHSRGPTAHKHKTDSEHKRPKGSRRRRKRDKQIVGQDSQPSFSTTRTAETPSTPGVSTYPTEDYEVTLGDTLTSVAARFDVTPSELCRINRLFCRSLFPGQTIKVPTRNVQSTEQIEQEAAALVHTDREELSVSGQTEADGTRSRTDDCCSEQRIDSTAQFESSDERYRLAQVDSSGEERVVAIHDEGEDDENYDDEEEEEEEEDDEDDDLSSMESDESYDVEETIDHATEENDPMAAQYLKLESDYIVNLQSAIPGLLLITTNSLMFSPTLESASDSEKFHLLLPLCRLRSIAAYADHSVMYFTKRDLQSKSIATRRRHQTDHSVSPSATSTRNQLHGKMTTESNKSDSAIFLHEADKQTESEELARVHTEMDTSTRTEDQMAQSEHPATNPYLLPTTNLTHKSKSAEFSSEHCFSHADKPVCSLPDLEHPDSVIYLCVLANPNGSIRKRHPHWFTIQSMEYWFRIPEPKADILFDFLLACDFREEQSSETGRNVAPTDDDGRSHQSDSGDPLTVTGIHGSRTTPANLFRTSTTVCRATGFVVVPNTFDWVLPRIGSIDECSKLMLKRSLRRKKHRTQSYKEHTSSGARDINSSPVYETVKTCGSLQESVEEQDSFNSAFSVPSLEEEKTALQILKRESVRWEWIRTPLRVLWHHIGHWLVNTAELENEQENAKRRQFILNCIQSATPENLPLPPSTEQSAILDQNKVRDLMRNLPPEAEGLDWQLTYSTALHGFSLRTLYHRCTMIYADELPEPKSLMSTSSIMPKSASGSTPFCSNEPCLLVIRTSMDDIFGAMLNTHLYPSSGRFYGNGSCYVFRWLVLETQHPCGTKRPTAQSRPVSIAEHPANEGTSTEPEQATAALAEAQSQRSVGARASLRSTSSLSDTDSSMFMEQGEEMTEDFARLFYLDESEIDDVSSCAAKPQQKSRFQKFSWTGKNTFFIGGENDSLTIGCSQGHSAIHLDDVLLHGRTEVCETFGNDPLCASGDFLVSNLEIWSFR